jgi:hypothetical protein
MFDIAILDEPSKLPLPPVQKVTPIAAAEPKKIKPISEPEERLRKVSAQIARIEFLALILFLTIAVVAVVSCFAELFQLLDNDSIGWVARRAIGGV